MDNKIKIIVSLLLGGLFCTNCAFDGNIEFYEIKINEWAKVNYWFQDKSDTATFSGFEVYLAQPNMKIGNRLKWDGSYRGERITQMSNRLVYNNDFMIADDGYENSESTKYYLIKPPLETEQSAKIEYITRAEFDSIESVCLDCKVMNKTKLQIIQYEEKEKESNSFPTKTVLFVLLVVAYVFYRIRKKK